MGTIAITLPTIGDPNSTEDADVRNSLSTLQTVVNGNIDGANAPALASYYRRLARGSGLLAAGSAANTYYAIATGDLLTTSLNDIGIPKEILDLRSADLAVTGLTAKLRLRATILTNNTAPAVNFTFGLYQITTATGGAGALTYTVNTVVATAAINAPAANLGTAANSADINLPTDGYYLFGVVTSGTMAASSYARFLWQADVRNV
jgi:hypothetical protein